MYTLLNKKTGRTLKHPQVGLWFTSDVEEAKEMLAACAEYVETLKMNASDFVIVDAESGELIEDELKE